MKKYSFYSIICAILVLASCQSKVDRPESILTQEQKDRINSQTSTPTPTAVGGSVFHYICPNGHSGGGDGAGTCAECGAELVHNQAFHNQGAPTTPPSITANDNTGVPGSTPPAGVQHYICPNGHDQGGPGAGTCPECGAELIHNQAYHSTGVPATPPTTNTNITIPDASASTPEPAQNAAGVWHYTCPNGHAGGAGSQVPCGECGTALVHNSAYHN